MQTTCLESPDSPALIPLPRAFYERPSESVARELLGRYLVLGSGVGARIGRIVETEAYLGEQDRASHAWRGRTRRTEPMYEEAGHAYVYFIYGMYWCLNVVTESIGQPCAVLLRATAPVRGLDAAANGPGKLCRAFGIDGRWNRSDFVGSDLRITSGQAAAVDATSASPRIGVAYAGDWASRPLRFFVTDDPSVSRRRTRPQTDN